MKKSEVLKLIAVLKAAYPQHPTNEETPTAYYLALSDLDYSTVMGAVQVHLRTSRFFPAPSELRSVVAEATTMIPEWEDAWDEVTSMRREYGTYIGERWGNQGGYWSTPLVESAVRHVGGYAAICCVEHKNEATMRAQFRDFYDRQRAVFVKRAQLGDVALPWDTQDKVLSIGDGE